MSHVLRRVTFAILVCVAVAPVPASGPFAQPPAPDPLEQGFATPPDAAKPRVWWHWMNGNITKEGIKLDLEWMQRVGIGGFQNFDAALVTPTGRRQASGLHDAGVEGRLQVCDHARRPARPRDSDRRLAGLERDGGPWVTPAQAMKKLVWSETRVEGGRPFTGALPEAAHRRRDRFRTCR